MGKMLKYSKHLMCNICSSSFAFFLSVVHCRCSKCYSVPARKRVRKRSSGITLLSLPEEVLLCVLQYLSAEDLLSIRAVSKSAHSDTAKLFITWDFSSAGVLIIFIYLFKCLFQVHSQLRDIVDNHSSVWARVSFRDTWPSPNTLWLFERYITYCQKCTYIYVVCQFESLL